MNIPICKNSKNHKDMKTKAIIHAIVLGFSAVMLASCINGNPGNGGKPAAQQNAPAAAASDNAAAASTSQNASQQGTAVGANIYPFSANPAVNVYLETSGSMNGYVNGGTSVFQQVVKEYLSGINNGNFAQSVNYFYINNKITPKGTDLTNYITRLTPSSFAAAGGGATTDIGGLFKAILEKTDNNTISIFISDCIISPGSNSNTAAYANGQMTDVRNAIIGYINQYQDLACLVYQFDSGFNGRYFDFQNKPHKVNMQRPFYIWVFGHTYNIAKLKLEVVPDQDFKVAPIRNQWMIFNTRLDYLQKDGVFYGLMLPNNMKNGKYTHVDRTVLRSIQKGPDGNFRFSFGANMGLAATLMGDSYIEDTNNYNKIVNKATRELFYGEIEKDYNQRSPYSHSFRVDSDSPFQKGTFTLAFIPKVPSWAYECTDVDDHVFNGDNDNKTYGLKYIFDGVFSGYNNAGHANILTEFNFEIK